MCPFVCFFFFFFFNDTATTEIYTFPYTTLFRSPPVPQHSDFPGQAERRTGSAHPAIPRRSEEHTSELHSRLHLVCRLLLEKKKKDLNRLIHKIKKIRISKKTRKSDRK